MGLTVTRTGPSLEEQFYRGLLDKALADCAARSPPGADVVVRIPLAGGHELRIEGAPDPTSWSVRVPNLETMFPKAFGDWRVDTSMPVILPSPDVQALLDKIYNQVLSRSYVNAKGERIMLSVAYGGDRKRRHQRAPARGVLSGAGLCHHGQPVGNVEGWGTPIACSAVDEQAGAS